MPRPYPRPMAIRSPRRHGLPLTGRWRGVTARRMGRYPAIAAAVAVAIGGCQSTGPTLAPAACGGFDLDAVRKSVRALPGWTATSRGTLERGGQTTLDEARIVRFVAPDQMMIEWRAGDETTGREWYLGNRAWLPTGPGLPEQNGIVFPPANDTRAAAMPLTDVDLPGTFRVADGDSPGPCVLASEDGRHQVFATVDGVYAGEQSSGMTDDTLGLVTVTFDPTVPSMPAPPA
jgi:hypothetical protein